MVTARAQQNTTEKSKGNNTRSSLFIAPTQLKKNSENTNEDKEIDLFITPTKQQSLQQDAEKGNTETVENTTEIAAIPTNSKNLEEQKEETAAETQETPQNETEKTPTVVKEAANSDVATTSETSGDVKSQTPQKSKAKTGGGGGGGKAYNVPDAPQAGVAEKEAIKEEEGPVALPTENSKVYADGLASQKPTNFIRGVKESSKTISEVQSNEQNTLKESLPEIEQPTGIPTKSAVQKQKAKASSEKAGEQIKSDKSILPDLSPKGKKEGAQISTKSVQPRSSAMARIRSFFGLGRSGSEEDRKSQIKRGISKLPTSESVSTNPGTKPKVDLTGQADPNKNKKNLDESTATTTKEQQKNIAESKLYKGEDDIYPEMELEMMSPTVELSTPPKPTALADEMPQLSAEVKNNFDENAKAKLDADLAPHMERQNAEYAKMEADQEKERQKSEKDIDKETERVKKEQEKAQNTAKSDVNTQRGAWQKENENVKKEYSEKSGAEKKKIDGKIDAKVKDADTKITKEYNTAKKKADKEVTKTDKEAARKKAQAKKDSEKKSWWDRAVSAVSNFFDKLKAGLNKLFDGLRKLVKGLIEAAKKFANKLIDLARDAIVGMIKVFGEALKVLVNVALAAFPKLRDKFNAAIDKAVNFAVEAVNTLAEGLKKAVNALLDLLGAALDAILAAYQAIFNLLLDAMKFLTVGLIKIMQGLANLVSAAIEMPGNFWGQLSEEFLGMDVTKPLPFERNTPYTIPGAPDVATATADPVQNYVDKGEYTPEDFMVESVPNNMELSDELMAKVAMLPENGEMEFGASNVETMEHLNIADTANSTATTTEDPGGITESVGDAGGGGMVMPPELYGNTTGQIDWFINKQSAQAPKNVPDSAEGKQAATQEAIPAGMRVLEPLGVGDRLYYLKTQMMTAIQKKWEENKALYITIGTLVVLAITALAIATGGAIFSLIPPALQIFAALMAGAALLKASGFFGTYMSEGWAGNIVKGGAALARAIGILLVELIFILLFDMSSLLKVLKAGVKGSVKMAITGTKNTFKALGSGLKASGKGLMKTGSKVVTGVKGIGKGVGKGAKTLDDFAKRMIKKAKFKGFKFTRKGKWFQIYGSVNPWVLLANGEVKEVKTKGKRIGEPKGPSLKVGQHGKFVTKEGDKTIEGILVGVNKKGGGPGSYVQGLKNTEDAAKRLSSADEVAKALEVNKNIYKKLFDEITRSTDNIAKINSKGVARNPHFRKNFFDYLTSMGANLSTNARKFLAVHHVVPNALKGNEKIYNLLLKLGHNIDEVENAIGLPRIDMKLLDDLIKQLDSVTDVVKNADEVAEITKQIDEIKTALKLPADVDLNQLKSILKELEDLKGSTIHAINSYHPRFSKAIKSKMEAFLKNYETLVKQYIDDGLEAGLAEAKALEVMRPKVTIFLDKVIDGLLKSGKELK
ncbi:hypothetical protein [Kordia jejudonensis]|uniref:hypothetical protein n=1 Tax=Kordia jejudonensis TaxID=1348245 RepID=UPI0006292562|nr:hypothetical protein [Kordia jejudonensis]